MSAAGGEWKAVDARTFTLTLKESFGLVLDGLAKPSGFPPVILPARLANISADTAIDDATGSGPYIFKKDEWVPGSKSVYVRNPNWVPRSEPADFLSGAKIPKIERVEWISLHLEIQIVRQANRQVGVLYRHDAALGTMNNRNRRAPITLPAN